MDTDRQGGESEAVGLNNEEFSSILHLLGAAIYYVLQVGDIRTAKSRALTSNYSQS